MARALSLSKTKQTLDAASIFVFKSVIIKKTPGMARGQGVLSVFVGTPPPTLDQESSYQSSNFRIFLKKRRVFYLIKVTK